MMEKLSQKHRDFVEVFDGNIVKSMRLAGYAGADKYLEQQGDALLKTPLIQEAIKERGRYKANIKKAVADREELMEMWSDIARNEDPYLKPEVDSNNVPLPMPKNIPLEKRLKATELLGKAQAVFIEKIDMTAKLSISDHIMSSYQKDEDDLPIEVIEAEYWAAKEKKQLPEPESPKLEDLI